MPTTLHAGYVYTRDGEDVIVVRFADSDVETHHYVLLQRRKSVVAEEVKLGHDRVHISIDDQARSCFGGIEPEQRQGERRGRTH